MTLTVEPTSLRPEPVPLPPPDPALAGLAVALNGDAMAELLHARLGSGFELRSCRPCYIRYKAGTNCVVEYRLELREAATRRELETIAHAKLYAGQGRAATVWAKGRLQELAADAAGWNGELPLEGAAHLPELGAVLQLYPVDLALPALAFAGSGAGSRHVLRQVLGREPADVSPVELVRYKPARKALLRYGSGGGALYAKLYADDRGPLVLSAGRSLQAAGVPTAPSLSYLPTLRMLVHGEVAGARLRELDGSSLDGAIRAAGHALARLHGATIADLPVHASADFAAELVAAARAVGAVRPDLAAEATRLVDRICEELGSVEFEPAPVHRDFYDDQVLVAGNHAVLLDLDEVGASNPLVDVGNFLAHLTVRGADEPARSSFLEGYGGAPPDRVALFETAGLLKLAIDPFRRLEADWPEGVEHRLRLATGRLREARRGRPRPGRRPLDPKLPQLAVVANPALVADALASHVYSTRVDVSRVEVVRHKTGRRCTLRYTLLVGSGPDQRLERVYGKTFASERGPRVHRTVRAIADARACGPAVALPEPVGYVPRLKLLLQREVPGVPAQERLLAGDEILPRRIAEALHALHASEVELERRHSLADELGALRERVEALGAHRGRARRLLERLEEAATGPFEWRRRPVHRDAYHAQILVDGPELAVLDFDDAAMSEPAVDVANFRAHLRLLALQEPRRAGALAFAAAAFGERCYELDSGLDPRLVRLLESATLLRLACIHEPLAGQLLRECAALLPAAEPRPPRR